MISVTWFRADRMNYVSLIHNTIVVPAGNTSEPSSPIWPRPAATTLNGLSPWPYAWWSKMAYPIAPLAGICGAITVSLSPLPPSRIGWKPGGKRASEKIESDYLDWALVDFSGYIAADELYDGPFCILSIVDNHTFKRVFYQVLDHAATQTDVQAFFQRFQAALAIRHLTVRGITTDGSDLYPAAIANVFGSIPHQLCQFHLLASISKAVLQAVAHVRKTLASQRPKLPRGRPPKQARKLVQQQQRLQQKISDLFTYRFLFVQRHLSPSERETFQRVTRGLPRLRTLREIMDEVYGLFDRRCRMATALAKLARLRQRVQRMVQLQQALRSLFSTNLEKALNFLDDQLLPATSNAVERGNRRYRKMQKTVYRVRTQLHIVGRIALDMFRDALAQAQAVNLQLLHQVRAAPDLTFIR
jgi:hypothetical protein